ncbi:Protein of unknown function [Escherichia coli D6-117.29]
MNWLE